MELLLKIAGSLSLVTSGIALFYYKNDKASFLLMTATFTFAGLQGLVIAADIWLIALSFIFALFMLAYAIKSTKPAPKKT